MNWDEEKAESYYESAATRAWLWVPSPTIVVTRAKGVGDIGSLKLYTQKMDRLLLSGNVVRAFHHWHEVDSFQPDARTYLRKWAAERKDLLADAHYLVRSSILAMAISAAALALDRQLISYTKESEFFAALDRALRATAPPRHSFRP